MAYGKAARRGGAYNRLAEPAWLDPLDISYSRSDGGRWNAPGSYGTLYLNASVGTARAQVQHKLAGLPYGIEDLDESEQHDLVEVVVPEDDYLDCVTDSGLDAVALPITYPRHPDGSPVTHPECWPIGAAARAASLPGVACRSAATSAPAEDEELAVFDTHAGGVVMTGRVQFGDWWYA
jgi:RES domain-containing protein